MQYVTLLLFAGVMYAILVVPQQRQRRQQQELLASLVAGDDILTAAGIYGTIVDFDEDDPQLMHVEIAEGVVVLMTRTAVTQVAMVDDPNDESER
jgi:preprotein translocase subunit YajC